MFHSATLKLTLWYLVILVAISLLFSIIIYTIASSEVSSRIGMLHDAAPPAFELNEAQFDSLRHSQVRQAEGSLLMSLVVTNVCIWIAGGIGSYYLARRTLGPIEEAHEAQSRFTSDASHELRTPLASMKTELEVALRDPHLEKAEMHDLLLSNLEEVNKLSTLAQNLLRLSRLEHDSIEREKLTLSDVAASVADRYDKERRRVRISGDTNAGLIASKSNVEELMTILLDNALKYSPSDSAVEIHIISRKQMAGFAISNEGNGISAAVLPHIFDRFYRADESRTSGEKGGYGLGLSLAKKIVELSGGELSVTSGEGETTTFRVLLPNIKKK
jgi:two-component system sensor histidine kinase CiaH